MWPRRSMLPPIATRWSCSARRASWCRSSAGWVSLRSSAISAPARCWGRSGLGSLINSFPALFWFTVGDAKDVAGIAELGIVFLLFLIGLELSLHRLLTMRRLVFGLGGLQVLITTALLAGVAGLCRAESLRGDHPRREPVAVLDRDRARTAFEAGAPDHQCRARQLCRAARCKTSPSFRS